MRRTLAVVLLVTGLVIAATGAAARASSPGERVLPGAFFPESITAAPDGTLFVSSITSGEIVRFFPGSRLARTFVPEDVNVGTAGVMADPQHKVLWACAIDLSFQTPSELRAFDLYSGALQARYRMPDGGVCADIALVGRDVYVTDTAVGRIDRVTRLEHGRADGGKIAIWSKDTLLRGGGQLKINGIAFDGARTLYTTNYSTGELFAVAIEPDGSAAPAQPITLDTPMTTPDGIRWCAGFLYVAENANGLSRIDVRAHTRTLIDGSLDQPSSLVFSGGVTWISEGQILRLLANQPPNLPFKIVQRPACAPCSGFPGKTQM
jgi:sugar lactone lactonase YvrE